MKLESWGFVPSLIHLLLISLFIYGCSKTQSEQEYMQNAISYWEKEDFRSSMIEVKNALQINPNNGEARLLLGRIYLKANQGVAGEKEIRVAAKLGLSEKNIMLPLAEAMLLQKKYQETLEYIDLSKITANTQRAELLVLQGQAYLGMKKSDKANDSFNDALKNDIKVKGAYLGLARVATVDRQFDLAERYLDKAIKQQPENFLPFLLKGEFYLSQQKAELAEELFRSVINQDVKSNNNVYIAVRIGLIRALLAQMKDDEAAAIAEALVKKFPDTPVVNYYRALTAYQKNDLETSETHVRNVLKVTPNHMQSIYLFGAISYAKKNYEQAVEYLNKFVAAVPSDMKAQKLLASTQILLKQPREAIEVLTQALEKNPDDPELLAMLGDVSIREGEHETGSKYLEKAVSLDPDNPDIRTDLAKAYLSMGKIDDGIKELQKTLTQDAQQQQAQLLLILTYFQQKDYDNALSVAKLFLKQSTDVALIHNLIGGIYAAKGEFAQSRKHFENAVKLRSDYKPALINLARMDFHEGNLKNARKRYEALLSVDPDNISVIMGLAQVLDNVGEPDEAVKWLKHAYNSNPDAITPVLVLSQYHIKKREYTNALELLNNSNKRYPDNAQLLFHAGQANLGLADYKTAQDIFRKVIALQPHSSNAYFYLALAYEKNKERNLARVALNKSLEITPTFLNAASMLVQLDIAEGRGNDAFKFVRNIQKEHPESATGFVLEGDLYMQGKRYSSAADLYEKALLREKRAKFVIKQSVALRKANNNKQAIAILNKWLTENPKDVSVHTVLATEYHKSKKNADAIKHYEKILEIQPNHIIALNNLAILYMEKTDQRALNLANQAYQLEPNAVTADTLGWIKLNQGDNTNGLHLIKQAADKAPGSQEIQYHLAAAYARNGNKTEAQKILQAILNSGESFNGIEDARALQKSLQGSLN